MRSGEFRLLYQHLNRLWTRTPLSIWSEQIDFDDMLSEG